VQNIEIGLNFKFKDCVLDAAGARANNKIENDDRSENNFLRTVLLRPFSVVQRPEWYAAPEGI
jgi:hypothetical protein